MICDVGAGVLFLEELFHLLAHILLRGQIAAGDNIRCDKRLQLDVKGIPGRHQMVVVDTLDEGLHLEVQGFGSLALDRANRARGGSGWGISDCSPLSA